MCGIHKVHNAVGIYIRDRHGCTHFFYNRTSALKVQQVCTWYVLIYLTVYLWPHKAHTVVLAAVHGLFVIDSWWSHKVYLVWKLEVFHFGRGWFHAVVSPSYSSCQVLLMWSQTKCLRSENVKILLVFTGWAKEDFASLSTLTFPLIPVWPGLQKKTEPANAL